MQEEISFEELQQFITRIYDAGLDERKWSLTLEFLTQQFNAEQSILRVLNTDERAVRLVYTFNKDLNWDRPYRDYFVHQDPWLDLFSNSDESVITCTHHHLEDKSYEKMEFYNDFVKPQQFHHGLGGLIKVDNLNDAYLIFHRNKSGSTFNDQQLDLMNILAPHIKRSLLIGDKTRHIEVERHLLKDALNKLNSPLLLVNAKEEILFSNEMAENLIRQHACISIKNRHLYIHSPQHQNLLSQLINQATQTDHSGLLKRGGGMNCSISANASSLYFLVSPVNPEQVNPGASDSNCALIFLSTNSHCPSIQMESLIQLYDFTNAEARLSCELCQGLSLDEITLKLSLSKNTLRSQLRSCFRKTGVDRQSSLINLIKNGPADKIRS